MNLHVEGSGKNGSLNADWGGEAKLKIALGPQTGCYRPLIEDDGAMHMTIEPYDFQWTQHDKDGEMQIQYKGPNSFNVPVDLVQLDICDPQPVLQLLLAGLHAPVETFEAKGQSFQNMMFGGFLATVVQANHINRVQTNAATGKSYPSSPAGVLTPLTGGSSSNSGANQNDVLAPLVPSGPSSSSASEYPYTRYQEAMAKITSHMGDTAWAQSADGKATQNEARQALKESQQAPCGNCQSTSQTPKSNSMPSVPSGPAAEIIQHKNDPGWITSAEGQAAINQLQQQAMAKLQAKLNAAGFVLPQEANASSLAATAMSVQLPWTNGQVETVNQTLKAKEPLKNSPIHMHGG